VFTAGELHVKCKGDITCILYTENCNFLEDDSLDITTAVLPKGLRVGTN